MTVIDRFKNNLFLHVVKATLTRHMVAAGVASSESDALDMIEAGVKLPGPMPTLVLSGPAPKAFSIGLFSNIITAVQSVISGLSGAQGGNLSGDLQILVNELPAILQLIALFSAL